MKQNERKTTLGVNSKQLSQRVGESHQNQSRNQSPRPPDRWSKRTRALGTRLKHALWHAQ